VRVGWDILKALHLRNKGVNLVACPSCSRQEFNVIATVNALESRLEDIQQPIDVAVIGCCVNGPGEAKAAQIGLAGGSPSLLYIDGKPHHKVGSANLIDEIERVVRDYVREHQEVPPGARDLPSKQTG